MTRGLIDQGMLTTITDAAFGRHRRLDGVARLRGGSKKGVYRLAFDDGSTAILYTWDEAENYWPADGNADPADPFSDASGLDFFTASQARLASLGVRTPQAYLIDGSRDRLPAPFALVEDVRGEKLEALLARDPAAAAPALAGLAETLAAMRADEAPHLGKIALVERGAAAQDRRCEQVVLDRGLRHLGQSAARVDRIAGVRDDLAATLTGLAPAVRPRSAYGLIHGELGPDHVLLDDAGRPVLIDIEGLMHFDVEWEHVFLRLRFGEHYRWLHTDGLDEQRLRLYALALHLSLVAGPLRLLDGDFPDREFMLGITEHNTRMALAFLD